MLVVYLVGPAIYYVAAALVVAHLNGLETTTSVEAASAAPAAERSTQGATARIRLKML